MVGEQVVQIDFPWKDAAEPWKVPKANNNYHRNLMDKGWRTSLKPLNIDQPEGPSFTVRPQSTLLDVHCRGAVIAVPSRIPNA